MLRGALRTRRSNGGLVLVGRRHLRSNNSWMGNLTVLAPYSPIFIGLTLLMLGLGYYFAYRRPKLDACATDGACGDTASRRATKVMLWIGTGLIALGIGFPYAAPLFY